MHFFVQRSELRDLYDKVAAGERVSEATDLYHAVQCSLPSETILKRRFGLLALMFLLNVSAWAEEIQKVLLPPHVTAVLARVPSLTNRLGFETNRIDPQTLNSWRTRDAWSYEQALEYLRSSQFPDITKCVRVKTPPPTMPKGVLQAATNQFLGLWLATNHSGETWVAAADFEPVPVQELPPLAFSPGDFNSELAALNAIYVERSSPTNHKWNLGRPDIKRRGLWVDSTTVDTSVMVHLAVCGLWLGMTNEVASLLSSARFRFTFTNSLATCVRAHAKQTWQLGLTNLIAGRPLADVLGIWGEHVRVFGTNVVPELPEYVTTLEKQADEFQRLLPATVEDPMRLPTNERGRYYTERLSLAKRVTDGVGWYKAGFPAPELIRLGKDALPALIEHLEDRRLTRVTGNRQTTVVLVQDLVLECVEQIAGGSFRNRYDLSGKFSVLSKSNRVSLATEVRHWFEEYGAKHLAFGTLALAESKPIPSRLFILEDLQNRYPGTVEAVPYLRRWASDAKLEEIGGVAWRLALLGDHSALPKVRAGMARGFSQNVHYLAAFGEPQDYVLLRSYLRTQMTATQDVQAVIAIEAVAEVGLGKRTNALTSAAFALPILREALECRRLIPSGKTVADYAFPALLKLTDRPSDYSPTNGAALKAAAMDAWQAWWNKEGNAIFRQQHPEIEAVFGSLESTRTLETDAK